MLTKLSVKNFRLLRDVSIDIEPGKPIVLIGPNGSGKSSVLQVLDLLQRSADDGLVRGLDVFGGVQAIATAGTSRVSIRLEVSNAYVKGPLHYSFELFENGQIHLEHLDVKNAEEPGASSVLLCRHNENVEILNEITNVRDTLTLNSPALMSHLWNLSFTMVKSPWVYQGLEALRAELSQMRIYGGFLTLPIWARDVREGSLSPFDSAVVAPAPRIDPRGLGLINALYDLQNNHHETWQELLDAFRAEFPFVHRIEFPADSAGGKIGLGWRDSRFPGVRMTGYQMSEGMTAYLCLLAAVLSPEPTAAIAFDEPDVHLHPSAMRRIVYLLEKASERTAVFVATHSDRFLDYLSDPAGSLRVCEPKDGGVTVQSLDRGALDEWRKDYSLAELRERGHLDSSNASTAEL